MALLNPHETRNNQDGDCTLVANVHGHIHTLSVNPSNGATGQLAVYVTPNGGPQQPLYRNGVAVVIDLADITTWTNIFHGCIASVFLDETTTIVGTYSATLCSQGSLPQD